MKTENVSTLKVHKLTQEQYDREVLNGTLEEYAIYITPDVSPVFDTIPTKNSDNYISSGAVFNAVDEVKNHTHFKRFLTETDDCDQLFEDGVYVYTTATVTNGLKNAPFPNAAVIEVFGADSTSTQKIQRAYRYGVPGYSAFRPLYSGKWAKWKRDNVHYALQATNTSAVPTFTGGQTAAQLFEDLENGNPVTISVTITNELGEDVIYFTPSEKNSVADACFYSIVSPYFNGLAYYSMVLTQDSISKIVKHDAPDYVVEQGTSGNWTHRKWASGIAECWGTVEITLDKDAYNWNSGIYCASGYGTLPSSVFTSHDCISIDPIKWYQIGASGRITAGGTLEGNVYGIGDDMTSLKRGNTVAVNCVVKGRWK